MVPTKILLIQDLTWEYGYDYLLTALNEVTKCTSDFTVKLLGAGPLYAAIRYSIDDLALADNLELITSYCPSEIKEMGGCSHIYINSTLTSKTDPFIHEIAKMEKIIVTSERLKDPPPTSYIYPPRKPSILARKLIDFISERK